jgi:hypothetical protein
MSGVSVSVNELEQQLVNAKLLVERRDRALRLSTNPDFRALILDEFCTTEAARYVQASADPALSDRDQANALALAQASGHLRRFLSVTMQMGNVAESSLVELHEAIEVERAEEDQQG